MRCSGYNFDGTDCTRRHNPVTGEHKRHVSVEIGPSGEPQFLITARCNHQFVARISILPDICQAVERLLDHHERHCETWYKVITAAMVANVQVGRDQ